MSKSIFESISLLEFLAGVDDSRDLFPLEPPPFTMWDYHPPVAAAASGFFQAPTVISASSIIWNFRQAPSGSDQPFVTNTP